MSETERPMFILSAYGPIKADANLIAGVDVSPDELRYRYQLAVAANDASQYVRSHHLT